MINPLDLEIMKKQPTLNVGIIGHVAHGKTTVVKAISGVNTIKHSVEKIKNITIKLGYANTKIYKCDNPLCHVPECYKSFGSDYNDEPKCGQINCGGTLKLYRHISFVDCPGHDVLMATMLNGASIMDGAMLLIAGNEQCPQPQTTEHLAAIEILNLKNIIILQNKLDLINETHAMSSYNDIKKFVCGTIAENSPIIPICAQQHINMDVVCQYLTKIPMPIRNPDISSTKLIIIRSFDINKPSTPINELKGGVIGGSLVDGILRVGQNIEIRPGYVFISDNKIQVIPIKTIIRSIKSENTELDFAIPGGLIGIETTLDPSLCRADKLIGNIAGMEGLMPQIYTDLVISFDLLDQIIGSGHKLKNNLMKFDEIVINSGSQSTKSKIYAVHEKLCKIKLNKPICAKIGETITISRKIDNHLRLIGCGKIERGLPIII